jgi:hypothetical protein
MAASLGLNPEALFPSYSCAYSSSPFMSDYEVSFPAAANAVDYSATAFSTELDDLHHFDYSPAPIFAGAGAGAGGDRNEKMMYVDICTENYYGVLQC